MDNNKLELKIKLFNIYEKNKICESKSSDFEKTQLRSAMRFFKTCDFKQALYCFKQLYDFQLKKYGTLHIEVAICLNNIGVNYRILSQFSVALDYLEQSLSVVKKVGVRKYPYEAAILNNIGLVVSS